MTKKLSSAAVEAYRRDGYYFPVPALSQSEVAHYRGVPGKARGGDGRAPARQLAAQGAFALHLGG